MNDKDRQCYITMIESLKTDCELFLYQSFLEDIKEKRTSCKTFDEWKEELRNADTSQVEAILSTSEGRAAVAKAMAEPFRRSLEQGV